MKNADESRQITKARRKLKKRLEVIDRQFTDSALKEVVDRMHSLIELPSSTEKKTTENSAESAKVSQSVSRLREQILKQIKEEEDQMSLAGRVTFRKKSDLPSYAHP
jgi:hypothetical protein